MAIAPKSSVARPSALKNPAPNRISLHAKLARGMAIPKAKKCRTCGK